MIAVNQNEFFVELEKALMDVEQAVYSVRIEKEDDGTFDIRIFDERLEEACEDIEEGHFQTIDEAEGRLKSIVKENPEVFFIRVED